MSEPLADPREIRKLLNEAAYRGLRIDGNNASPYMMNTPSALINSVFRMAEASGYSGEDAMTVLAYHALLRYENTLDILIEQSNLTILKTVMKSEGDLA